MIGRNAAFSIFRKWRDANPPTRLRVDAELGVFSFSLDCSVARVDFPLIGFSLGVVGVLEFVFDETWDFDFMALDAARLRLDQRVGDLPVRKGRCEFGEIVLGVRAPTGSQMIFAEIVREV
jgi:hypothetical protein